MHVWQLTIKSTSVHVSKSTKWPSSSLRDPPHVLSWEPQALLTKLLQRKRWRQIERQRQMKPEQTVVSDPSHIPQAHHMINLPPASDQGCRGSACVCVSKRVEEAKWWMLVHVMTWRRRRRILSSHVEAAITHSITTHKPYPPCDIIPTSP